jgi:hypothetical protein
MALFNRKKNSPQQIEANETGSSNVETAGLSQGQIIRKRFFQHKPAIAGLIFMIV